MMFSLEKSQAAFALAQTKIPGGVNSPARAFKAVGGTPPYIQKAQGAWLWDIDGNAYIDYIGSWGPMILGHRYPAVIEAIQNQLAAGTSYGAPTEIETQMAQLVIEAVPSIEKVRMVNSGTEAVMSAIRLARGYTGRDKILKFSGCYHGHSDMLLAEAGSGVASLGIPGSPGVPAKMVENTLTVAFNDLVAVQAVFETHGESIAAVVLEPVAGNMGLVLPLPGFLEGLREITSNFGTVLIFDEVMTGFRLAFGGAQARFGITPDLTCLGKIIGGGLPVGAYGGKAEIMEHLAPVGPVYQAGTLSGNPLAMAAGVATLQTLKDQPQIYTQLENAGQTLQKGIIERAKAADINVQVPVIGSMLCVFFTPETVIDYASAKTSELQRFARFHHRLLSQGIYLPPAQFEAWFISAAHGEGELETTLNTIEQALANLKDS